MLRCDECLDSCLVTRITSGVVNQSLRRKLLAIDPPPDLPDVLRLCRSEESAMKTETDLDNAGNVVKRISTNKRRPRSASRGRQMGATRCTGCGGSPHPQGRLKQCKAWGFPADKLDVPSTLLDFWKIRGDLATEDGLVLYGSRLVVTASLRRQVLSRLHDSHRGIEATKRRARQVVWWPGINSDITSCVKACHACQEVLPSQQKEPLISDPLPSRPFEDVSADLFTHAGKDYLIYADRLSGWPCVAEYGREASSRTTTKLLCRIFRDVGVPVRLRSDGGPQFTSSTFRSFTQRWGINHVMSSPGYPQSNGHAEAFVKVKYLIAKVCATDASDEAAF
ncbi:uncharacterized protein K02A2.6-like isoform X1 [Portunus trituberculatus]|uniref:uncharacterized protein K02A2.6-like isoform X1 n=1 Tax=Portunus trituberculatus TaxID=210409 RepID=UPI001E1CD534|nr:uncharacterized protein K02A2.6-like isoform X1 [Portunus trituberculatus]